MFFYLSLLGCLNEMLLHGEKIVYSINGFDLISTLCLGHRELYLACSQLPTSEIGKNVFGHEEAVMALRRRWGGGEHSQLPLLTGGTPGVTAMTASWTKKSWQFGHEGFTCNEHFPSQPSQPLKKF